MTAPAAIGLSQEFFFSAFNCASCGVFLFAFSCAACCGVFRLSSIVFNSLLSSESYQLSEMAESAELTESSELGLHFVQKWGGRAKSPGLGIACDRRSSYLCRKIGLKR